MERDTLKIWDVKNESRLPSNRLFRVLIHDYAHWLPRSHVLVSRWILYHCIERRLFIISWSQCVRKALFSWWTQSRAKCYTKPMWSIPLYFVSLLIAVVQRHIYDQRHALWCPFRFEGWYFTRLLWFFRPTASRCAHPVLWSKSRLCEFQLGDSFRSCLTLQIPVGYGECVSMDIDRTQKQMCTASTDKFCYAMNLQCCCVSSRIRCP